MFYIIQSSYYPEITDALFKGASAVLDEAGVEYGTIAVPGVLEIPPMIAMNLYENRKTLQATSKSSGYIALGCVIRGETSHYDIVAGESARALMDISVNNLVAIGNGILTVENKKQAMERADPKGRDKGGEAARAMLALSDSAANCIFPARYAKW